MISGAAVVAGVVGDPVTHSLSPALHNAWIAAAGLDAVYVPFSPGPGRFEPFVRGLAGGAIRGLNVTIPFKEAALALADEADDLAQLAGAANLLILEKDGRISARNTDGPGMLGAIAQQAPGFDPRSGPAVILGAGGAARGAAAALKLAGAPAIWLVNRTLERAETIAGTLGQPVSALSEAQLVSQLGEAALIVNATSLGLGGGPGPPLDFSRVGPDVVVMDMVYKPLETEFLRRARMAGLRTVDGLEMLIRQAMPSFEAFFLTRPPPLLGVRRLTLEILGDAR